MLEQRLRSLRSLALLFVTASLLAIGWHPAVASSTSQASPSASVVSVAPTRPPLEPKALELLKLTSQRLAAAHTITFTAVELFESMSRQRHPLTYTTKYEVALQRPNKLRVIDLGDGPRSDFYYNGTTMMAYAPAENLVAISNAPPTIDAMLQTAYKSAAIYFPFTDLIVTDPYADVAKGLSLAYYIGRSNMVGGTTTDMVALVANGVFEQVWIGTADKLPRLIRAVFINDPEQLRHELSFSTWRLGVTLSADTFTLAVAANAKHMKFADPEAWPSPGAGRPQAPKPKASP